MAFIAQDTPDAASEAEHLPKATAPGFRLADAFTGSRTLGNLTQVTTTARLAASMAGMVPKDFNVRLAESMGVAKIVKDLNATHAAILRSGLPQVSLMQSLAASGMLRDFNTSLAASIAGMVPKDFNVRLAESMGVAKIVKDLNATHAAILRSGLPQVSLMQSLAASGMLRDFIEMQARLAAIARTAPSDSLSDTEFGTTLSRESERLLFGNFVYCLVLSLVLLAYIRVTGESETDSQIFSLFVFATGLGAHQIAKLARDAAFRAYDFLYPPE